MRDRNTTVYLSVLGRAHTMPNLSSQGRAPTASVYPKLVNTIAVPSLGSSPIAFTFCDVLHTIIGMKCIVSHSLELHQKGYSCITRNSIEPGLEDATIDIE